MAATKNVYKVSFTLSCPSDNEQIFYKLKIISVHRIMVEQIKDVLNSFGGCGLHEDVADKMQSLGGKQKITAMHQGVTITTFR